MTAEEVNEDGTVERFPVTFTPGVRYILCWSSGVPARQTVESGEGSALESTPDSYLESKVTAKGGADSRLMTQERQRRSSQTNQRSPSESSPIFSVPSDLSARSNDGFPSSVELSAKEELHALDLLLQRSDDEEEEPSEESTPTTSAPPLQWMFLKDIVPDGRQILGWEVFSLFVGRGEQCGCRDELTEGV